MLVLAGFIVVAYLTGMRDSEVQDMRRGCLRRHRSNDGSPTRWYIRSRVWKARNVMGDPEQWVAIDEVAKAVQVIERLHEVMGSPADCYLFGLGLSDSFKQRRADLPIGQGIGRLLDLFRNHVNALAKRSTMTKPIPEWEGQVWTFSSRQFRRTLAWHIVNRPFGTVAGMRHFKHLGIQIMEGWVASLPWNGWPLCVEYATTPDVPFDSGSYVLRNKPTRWVCFECQKRRNLALPATEPARTKSRGI